LRYKLNKINVKLKWRVFGFLLGFCLLLLIILWLFQIVFLNDFYRLVRITEIRSNASTIISHINDNNLQEVIIALAEEGDFVADILYLDGQSVLRRSRPSMLDQALIKMASDNGGEFYEYSANLKTVSMLPSPTGVLARIQKGPSRPGRIITEESFVRSRWNPLYIFA